MATTVSYTVLNGRILSENRNGVKRDYLPDPQGNVIALLDNTQTLTDTFDYFPYGEVASRTGTTQTPFQYLGTLGYYQDNSGRTYVRARHLRTAHGRWMTQDPIGFDGGDWNLYRYVGNMAVTAVDPDGNRQQKPGRGNGLVMPKPGIGKRECPGADAVDHIRKLFKNEACAAHFRLLCNQQSLGNILSQIRFMVKPLCADDKDPRVPCLVNFLGDGPGKPCTPVNICFNSSTCNRSKERRASHLLFEIGNWCNCKFNKMNAGETPTETMCLTCGFPMSWCIPGGIKQ